MSPSRPTEADDHRLLCDGRRGGCGAYFGFGFHSEVVLRRLSRGEVQRSGNKVTWCHFCGAKWEIGAAVKEVA